MVTRKSRKRKTRKAARRPASKRKPARRKRTRKMKGMDSPTLAFAKNRKAHWDVYRDLQRKADRAWAKLRSDVNRKADPEVLVADRNNLLLLLGECNYLAGECMRMKMIRTR
jgi:hypothetical protein